MRRPVAYKWTDPVPASATARSRCCPPVTVDASTPAARSSRTRRRSALDVTVRSVRGAVAGRLRARAADGIRRDAGRARRSRSPPAARRAARVHRHPARAPRSTGHAARRRDGRGERSAYDRGLRAHRARRTSRSRRCSPPPTVQLGALRRRATAGVASATSPARATRSRQALRQVGYDVTLLDRRGVRRATARALRRDRHRRARLQRRAAAARRARAR